MKQTFWINNNDTDRIYMLEKTEEGHPGIDWRQDYFNMQRYFIYGQSLDFEQLIKRIQELQMRLRNI